MEGILRFQSGQHHSIYHRGDRRDRLVLAAVFRQAIAGVADPVRCRQDCRVGVLRLVVRLGMEQLVEAGWGDIGCLGSY